MISLGSFTTVLAATTEYDSTGVRISVEITPLGCVTGCGPAPTPLPPTGGVDLSMWLWIAAAVIALGVALVFAMRGRTLLRSGDSPLPVVRRPYDGLIDRRSSPVGGRTEQSVGERPQDTDASRGKKERGDA